MSVNFGYGGYGMMNGMNMMGNMQGNAMQSGYGQFNCTACSQRGVVPYNLQTNVNPLPPHAFRHSWINKIFGRIFG